ncbi:uncharacterized protein LOC134250751, partial [Saccostrea cucullata]|uniref:uncharacterized protein LOC134250751 n=1 Tax=Saccostrea cuccullata TaxID=36930 RepID=UPI002ED6BB26
LVYLKPRIQKSTESNQADTEDETASESGRHTVPVSAVLSEINERKNRECNMIIYGIEESDSDNKEVRRTNDGDKVKEIAEVCEVNVADESTIKLMRLGKFNKDKKRRPLLVTFSTPEKKVEFFKRGGKLRENIELSEVRLANDLTRTERENEKKLYMKAKELNKNGSGEFHYRVRGPPWARKVVKLRMIEGVQRRATKQIPGLAKLSYEERLKKLKLPTLKYRRHRGEMIEVYKITSGKYDPLATDFIKLRRDQVTREQGRGNLRSCLYRDQDSI